MCLLCVIDKPFKLICGFYEVYRLFDDKRLPLQRLRQERSLLINLLVYQRICDNEAFLATLK